MGRKKSSKAKKDGGGESGGGGSGGGGEEEQVKVEEEAQEQQQLDRQVEQIIQHKEGEEKFPEPVALETSTPSDISEQPSKQEEAKAGDESSHKYSLEQLLKSTDALPSLNELRPSLDSDGYIKPVPMQQDEADGEDDQSLSRSELLRALSGGSDGGAASEFLKRTGLEIPEECDPGIPYHKKGAVQEAQEPKSSASTHENLFNPAEVEKAVEKAVETAVDNVVSDKQTLQEDDRQRAAIPPSDDDLVTEICASSDESAFKVHKSPSDVEVSSAEAWTTAAFFAVGTISILWVALRLTVLKRS